MAFDGITTAALTAQLNTELLQGRIYKIIQPESDEILLTIRTGSEQKRLLLSASPSLPLVCLDVPARKAPLTAPNFCMLLRKHIQNGRISRIYQPGLERVIHIEIEHLNELQDLTKKTLIIELMGKHSNLIFVEEDNTILDSIRHVSASMSSVREVLPGRKYFLPDTQKKRDPLSCDEASFSAILQESAGPISKVLLASYTGISPIMAEEICHRANIESKMSVTDLNDEQKKALYAAFSSIMECVRTGDFSPEIYYENGVPVEYAAFSLSLYDGNEKTAFSSMSEVIDRFYAQKEHAARIRQKSSDLHHILQTSLERACKKQIIQETQLKSTKKREQYRVYGELLQAYSYQVPQGLSEITLENYTDNTPVKIPLDENKTAIENAKHYFDRYQKLKRTNEAVTIQLAETRSEIVYLESVTQALSIAQSEADLAALREELQKTGFIRSHGNGKGKKIRNEKSQPFHYVSADGYDIYVGKNNLQNDELTFKTATGNDWWFHAKQIPGSHVIVKSRNEELPDTTFEEAARLAAHYSKGASSDKVEIDYVQKKHLKKPNGARPGFVIYHTNYSMTASTDIAGIREV